MCSLKDNKYVVLTWITFQEKHLQMLLLETNWGRFRFLGSVNVRHFYHAVCSSTLTADTWKLVISYWLVCSFEQTVWFSLRTGLLLVCLSHSMLLVFWHHHSYVSNLQWQIEIEVFAAGKTHSKTYIYLHFSHYNQREAEMVVTAASQSRVSQQNFSATRKWPPLFQGTGLKLDRWTNLT